MIKHVKEIPIVGKDKCGLYWNTESQQMLCMDTITIWYISGRPEDFGEKSDLLKQFQGVPTVTEERARTPNTVQIIDIIQIFESAAKLAGR